MLMVGVTAAIIGSAVIGAGTSALAASKNSKAINKATTAEQAANAQALAAQERARSENLALQQPLYNAGLPAMNARNALLGLGGTQQAPQGAQLPTPQPNALSQFQGYNPDTSGGLFGMARQESYGGMAGQRPFEAGYIRDADAGYQMPGQAPNVGPYATPASGTQMGQSPQQAATNAFDMFRGSTGYQFRLGEGMRAINGGYAGAGTIQSGAAMKAINDYGQNMASSEFGNYMGYLGDQQNLTAGAANAMSGVNSSYANNASNLAIANGQTAANAAVARANNSNAMLGSMANLGGSILGATSNNFGFGFGGGSGGWAPSTNGGLTGATGSIFGRR